MAYITLDRKKLNFNYNFLNRLFVQHNIEWAVVSKLLCGNRPFLTELIQTGIEQLCDSRIPNLKMIKEIAPHIQTIYIKPPALRTIPDIVKYADISCNTEYRTLKCLSDEAGTQEKEHKVIIMIELGELREGVLKNRFISFYERAILLPHLQIVGIGAHFTCISGVLPEQAKLQQLIRFRDLIATRFGKILPYISGGSSVTIPLILQGNVPMGINHFRIGESLFFGTDVYHSRPLKGMYQDVICLYVAIIELIEKPLQAEGRLAANVEGRIPKFRPEDVGKTSFRAILDVGLLDVEYRHLFPTDPKVQCIGSSSDMLIVNLGSNAAGYKVGDLIEFRTDYMGALRLMNSHYIHKKVIDTSVVSAQ